MFTTDFLRSQITFTNILHYPATVILYCNEFTRPIYNFIFFIFKFFSAFRQLNQVYNKRKYMYISLTCSFIKYCRGKISNINHIFLSSFNSFFVYKVSLIFKLYLEYSNKASSKMKNIFLITSLSHPNSKLHPKLLYNCSRAKKQQHRIQS